MYSNELSISVSAPPWSRELQQLSVNIVALCIILLANIYDNIQVYECFLYFKE